MREWAGIFRAVIVTGVLAMDANAGELPDAGLLPPNSALPDPLRMFDGSPVTTKEQWFQQRRPELKKLFQHYVYGYTPQAPTLDVKVTKTDPTVFGGQAILKEVDLRFQGSPENAPVIHLAIFLPAEATKPVPVFLGLNARGNQAVTRHEGVTAHPETWARVDPKDPNRSSRGVETDFWCVENSIRRGYAFATFHESDIDPDKNDFSDGVHPHFHDIEGPNDSRWGTIAAWAWGLSRCVDYLVTDPAIAKDKICLIGHSRRGKTALLAGAFDERVAIVVPHQSGTGGCALSRHNRQETVERINRVFPHLFNDQFPKFGSNVDRLPIDQHLLIALVAPRALLDTEGKKDLWANYDNAYEALRAADKVYKFLGARGMVGTGLLEGDTKIDRDTAGDLLQLRLDTQHTLNIDYWNKILDFADSRFFPERAGK